MALIDGLLQEIETEAQTTRRVIASVADEQLSWRPNSHARTVGELALQVATLPRSVAELVAASTLKEGRDYTFPSPTSASELLPALEQSISVAKQLLGSMDDAALLVAWRLIHAERELFAIPRGALLHSLMLNHWCDRRAQLAVYLRGLGIGVPVNRASGNENLFHSNGSASTSEPTRSYATHL
jgi:hypothetical protein